jgi:hypothetical protein
MSDQQSGTGSPPFIRGSGSTDDAFERAYPTRLREQEGNLIRKRRQSAGITSAVDRLVGFGLSGGGIRSATFALGLFQGMAQQRGLLRQIDYLSTVSGGGYFGSFLGRLFTRDFVQNADDVELILRGEKYPSVLKYLRENGRYLSPNGAGDLVLAGAVLLRNFLAIHAVLAVFGLMVFLVLQLLRVGFEAALAGRFPWLSSVLQPTRPDSGLWWSPLLILPAVTFVVAVLPLIWAYWLVEPRRLRRAPGRGGLWAPGWQRSAIPPWAGLLLVWTLALLLTITNQHWDAVSIARGWGIVLVVTTLTCLWWAGASLWTRWKDTTETELDRALYWPLALRHLLSLWLMWALVITGGLLVLAVVDSCGQTVYAMLYTGALWAWITGIFSALLALAGLGRQVAVVFSKGPEGARPRLPVRLIVGAVALLLAFVLLVALDTTSHAIAWNLQPPPAPRDLWPALLGCLSTFLLSVLLGQTLPFVNRSSHAALYAARLTRAYLGASNRQRWQGGHSITEVLPDDDYDLARYWPPPAPKATPLHLINVTINETIDGRSQVQQQDRKGTGMAIGPCALSVGVEHHALVPFGEHADPFGTGVHIYPPASAGQTADRPFRVFEYPDVNGTPVFTGETMPLGAWVGISGAAFSTGVGMQTSLGLSFLAGFGNIRLGRWWDSGIDLSRRKQVAYKASVWSEHFLARVFPVQVFLFDEFLARFHGTARRHWYLSDGGHFENLGGYELVRRRLRTIVIVDAEQDTDFTFSGLANLVRKARLDFGAEIQFLTEAELDAEVDESVRHYFGTLEHLRRGTWQEGKLITADPAGLSLAYAALARIVYSAPQTPPSRLLYIKPTLMGDESTDILQYHQAHPQFPHESTADQFFDEAQWESYRRLGQHIADRLFGGAAASLDGWSGKWRPGLLAE